MLDLETLGTGPNALIISIGAVKFDPQAIAEVEEKFHVGIDLSSLPPNAYGFDIEPGTVSWWLSPERAPGRDALSQVPKTDIASALDGFAMWVANDTLMWGNGAAFDNVLLRNAYMKLGLIPPWNCWEDRCYRTLKNLAPSLQVTRVGAHHSAVEDALTQAYHLQQVVKHLNIGDIS
jgi:exodeoxyribonuclease VIII